MPQIEPRPDPVPPAPETSLRPVPLSTILTVFAVGLLMFVAWRLQTLLLMSFGAILLAIALRSGALYVSRRAPISPRYAVLVVAVFAALVLTSAALWIGADVARQFNQLISGLPKAWDRVTDWVENSNVGKLLQELMGSGGDQQGGQGQGAAGGAGNGMLPGIFNVVRGTFNTVTGMAANMILILTMAIFLAMDPSSYREGALKLVPLSSRDRARGIMSEIGTKEAKWMAGQSLDMIIVGIVSGLGLWALGVPLALVLGIIAGLTNIIPLIGPFLSGIPAVLFALTQGGPQLAVYVALLFIVIQQVEGNILLPMIQKRASNLPPVLTVVGVVGFGALFGLPGIILSTPLLIVLIVLVNRLYVQDILEDQAFEDDVALEDAEHEDQADQPARRAAAPR